MERSSRYHLTWASKVRVKNRTNQHHAPLWQGTLRPQRRPFSSVPAKDAGAGLILSKGQMSPNWGLFYKPLARNRQKYRDHESQGKTEELFQDWRRLKSRGSSMQRWCCAALFGCEGQLVDLKRVGGLGSNNTSMLTCWLWWMFRGCIRERPSWDFPSGPVVKNPWNTGDKDLIPGQGTKIPHAAWQQSLRAITRETPCTATKDPTRWWNTDPVSHN